MDLPVIAFIQERLLEADETFEVRKGTAFYDLFIKPQELMMQPLLSAMDNILIGQSVRRVLALDDPNAFDQENVNDLAANVYVERDEGGVATVTVRVFYNAPVDREFPALNMEVQTGSGLSFFNLNDFVITSAQMALQQSGNLFYFDVLVRAQNPGSEYNVEIGDISQMINDTDAVSVTNLAKATGGLAQETNTELLDRSKNSIGVRDLETIKGINAILREKFPSLREIQAVGMGDPEMMRDIVYNAHVGGKTDVYLKTPELQTLSTDVIGLVFDETRELHRNIHMQLTATSFADPASDLATPLIVANSVVVKEDVIETAAFFITESVPPVTGIDLSAGQYIKLQVDNNIPINIKVSGATPANTQRFEIIDAINAATGLLIATPHLVDKIKVTSPTIGANSVLRLFTPDLPRTDATDPVTNLVPDAAAAGYSPPAPPGDPAEFFGIAAQVYVENVDYEVDYDNGRIRKLPGSAITSGDTIAGPATDGVITASSNEFSSPTLDIFEFVKPGDLLVITAAAPITGIDPDTYVISELIDNQTVRVQGFAPTGSDVSVEFYVVSSQVVVIDLDFNPLSVDVGPNVLLSDGLSRGIRPGREDYTIKDVAFIDIISIEEIDPDTQEGLGIFLSLPGGYGSGGYGEGGYGAGMGGDFEFIVNRPTERFSAFEDSVIVFDPALFGKSYRITYYAATEIAAVHNVCRSDLERVTGADVLPKNFCPVFVDMEIFVRRDPTNLTTPDNAGLAQLVRDQIDGTLSTQKLEASDIIKLLQNTGLDTVRVPFTMTGTVVHTDGSTSIIESEDTIQVPEVVLPKDTDDFVTPRITHLYDRNIVITEYT